MLEGFDWFRPTDLPALFKALQASKNPAVLVGGQSLTFWVDYFKIPTPAIHTPYLTQDADVLASKVDAQVIADNLINGKVTYPPADDHTINNAIIVYEIGSRKLLIDVLGTLCGLNNDEIKSTAIKLDVMSYGPVNILHPRLVLISRISNLLVIKSKRNPNGITQAKLSIIVYKQFLLWYKQFLDDDQQYQKYLLEKAEELKDIALSEASRFVFNHYGIRVLDAFPIELATNEKFIQIQWPKINDWFNERVR